MGKKNKRIQRKYSPLEVQFANHNNIPKKMTFKQPTQMSVDAFKEDVRKNEATNLELTK